MLEKTEDTKNPAGPVVCECHCSTESAAVVTRQTTGRLQAGDSHLQGKAVRQTVVPQRSSTRIPACIPSEHFGHP